MNSDFMNNGLFRGDLERGPVQTVPVEEPGRSPVGLREALAVDSRRAMRGRRTCYGEVADYDPVLRYHCRLD